MQELTTYAPALPEIAVAIGALLILMLGVFRTSAPTADYVAGALAIVVLLVAAKFVLSAPDRAVLFDGAFIVDGFGRFMKLARARRLRSRSHHVVGRACARQAAVEFEYVVLLLLSVLGMMLMISAGRPDRALPRARAAEPRALRGCRHRPRRRALERGGPQVFRAGRAVVRHVALRRLAASTASPARPSFTAIAAAAHGGATAASVGLIIGLVFLLVGLAFKISAVPFHMWTPDVYEGAPTPVTAFFAAAPKVAAMALLMRVMLTAFPGIAPQWQQIVVFLSIASMLLGAFAAIGQTNIKRLMAYSSIGHIGYALIGLAADTPRPARSRCSSISRSICS